jgi:hypothetical protein
MYLGKSDSIRALRPSLVRTVLRRRGKRQRKPCRSRCSRAIGSALGFVNTAYQESIRQSAFNR